jgi:phage-related protein
MGDMDIAADTLAPTVEWAPVARTMMEQLPEAEQAEVCASVDQAARRFDPRRFRQVTSTRQGQRPFFVMQATPTLRVFFAQVDDGLRVLDVVDAEQLAYFRDEAVPAAN